MTVYFLLCTASVLLHVSAVFPREVQPRIVGGQQSVIEETPYLVSLHRDKNNSKIFTQECGGSILNATIIITSADCINGSNSAHWKVRAGSKFSEFGGQFVDVKEFILHPEFNEDLDYDVALMILETPLNINGVETVAIPLVDEDIVISDNHDVKISGFGRVAESSSTYLLKTLKTTVMNQEVCKKAYGSLRKVTEHMICSGNMDDTGVGVCYRDFGGPMVMDGKLAGIISWSFRCGVHGYPPVYTRVSSVRSWIDSQFL